MTMHRSATVIAGAVLVALLQGCASTPLEPWHTERLRIDGHISKCGDADVRCTLYTAANAMLTRSSRWSSLKAWGMNLAKTRGHRKAVIAVARKLAVILHRMRLDDTQIQWGTEAARS